MDQCGMSLCPYTLNHNQNCHLVPSCLLTVTWMLKTQPEFPIKGGRNSICISSLKSDPLALFKLNYSAVFGAQAQGMYAKSKLSQLIVDRLVFWAWIFLELVWLSDYATLNPGWYAYIGTSNWGCASNTTRDNFTAVFSWQVYLFQIMFKTL